MHLFPGALDLLPDAGFAAAGGDEVTIDLALGEAGVAEYHHRIAEPAQVRPRHGHVHLRWLINGVRASTETSPARVMA